MRTDKNKIISFPVATYSYCNLKQADRLAICGDRFLIIATNLPEIILFSNKLGKRNGTFSLAEKSILKFIFAYSFDIIRRGRSHIFFVTSQ